MVIKFILCIFIFLYLDHSCSIANSSDVLENNFFQQLAKVFVGSCWRIYQRNLFTFLNREKLIIIRKNK